MNTINFLEYLGEEKLKLEFLYLQLWIEKIFVDSRFNNDHLLSEAKLSDIENAYSLHLFKAIVQVKQPKHTNIR